MSNIQSEESMEEETITPEVVQPGQFIALVQESGLDQSKAQFLIEQFQDHFKMAAEWAKKAKNIVVTHESQVVNMKMARTGRLFLREKRLEIETARKALKEQSLREGKAIDKIAGFLKDLIIPTEEHLDRQEHFVEYKKKAEEDALRAEVEKRMEEERLAKEAADRERLLKLEKEAQEHEKTLAAERKKHEEENKKIREAKEKSDRENREKVESLERELRLKKQAEAKAEADRIKSENALKSAGDAEKLWKLRQDIEAIKLPECSGAEGKSLVLEIKGHLYMAVRKIQPIEEEQ